MTMTPRPRDAGVTLVEMLVALVLFALVGLAAFTVLDTIIRSRDRTEGRLEAVASLDRALILFSRDMGQSAAGGRSLTQGILSVAGQDGAVALRLDYQVLDGQLVRTITQDGKPPLLQPLTGGVTAVRWRILDRDGAWQDVWPLSGPAPDDARAVEVQLTLAGQNGAPAGLLRRIVELPRAATP